MKLWQSKKDLLSVKELLMRWWLVAAIVLIAVLVVVYQVSVNSEMRRTKWSKLLAANNVGAESAGGVSKPIPEFSDDDIISGKASAKVKLIVYIDFTCPFSAELFQTLKQVRGGYEKDLAIAWRMFPLAGQAEAEPAAKAFICVAKQGYVEQMAEKLFAMQTAGEFAPEKYRQIALELGVKLGDYEKCLVSEETSARIMVQKTEAEAAGVIGTPHMFTKDNNYPGAVPMRDFTDNLGVKRPGLKTIIDKLLENK